MVIRDDLWEMLCPALRLAHAAGVEKIDSGQYISRQQIAPFRRSDSGWPLALKTEPWPSNSKAPPDWKEMFSREPAQLAGIPMDTVPELALAVRDIAERCMNDEILQNGVSLIARIYDADPAKRRETIEQDVLRLIGTILNRSEATGGNSDEELLAIYEELERGRFGTHVAGDLMVPLALTAFDLEYPLAIAEGLWLEPIDEELQIARAPSWRQTDRVSPWVIAAATHALVLRDITVPNDAWGNGRILDQNQVDFSFVNQFIEAIIIEKGIKSGYAQVVMRARGWAVDFDQHLPAIWKIKTLDAYPGEFDDAKWNDPPEPISIQSIHSIAKIYTALVSARPNVQLAARRLRLSTMRLETEDEILDAAIGIEALLGGDKDELTHRISLRAAAALADEVDPNQTYALIKKVYGIRSTIVHGNHLKSETVQVGNYQISAREVARTMLQWLLRNCLIGDEPWTPESLDRTVINRLKIPGL